MKLKTLLKDLKVLYAPNIKNIDIEEISMSTKDVSNGALFVCLKGQNFNGHLFKEEAKSKGAVCFVVEEYDASFDGIQILVKNTREALSILAKKFYKHKKKLKIIGITGTNGKTTTSFMVANILKLAGKNVGVIGTEGVYYNDATFKFNMTTPDPIDLFKSLKLMSDSNIDYVVMEVSAHAIYLNKIYALNFYVKALTNITEDHLDFFKTMEDYSQTKVNFMEVGDCIKVVNQDDEYGYKLILNNKKMYAYSLEQESDVIAYDISTDCSSYKINLFGKTIEINTNLIGSYNVENALCACTIAKLIGIDDKYIQKGLNTFKSVPGRMNVYRNANKIVIIDFAHTPDAIEKVLKTVRPFTQGKLTCLFGCGGNRDTAKRKIMGEIASSLADKVIITNDNPRFEDQNEIAHDITSGIKKDNYEIILNRSKAIQKTIQSMSDGDVIVLCGKGAEEYMDIKGIKHPYSDKQEVLKWGFKE